MNRHCMEQRNWLPRVRNSSYVGLKSRELSSSPILRLSPLVGWFSGWACVEVVVWGRDRICKYLFLSVSSSWWRRWSCVAIAPTSLSGDSIDPSRFSNGVVYWIFSVGIMEFSWRTWKFFGLQRYAYPRQLHGLVPSPLSWTLGPSCSGHFLAALLTALLCPCLGALTFVLHLIHDRYW